LASPSFEGHAAFSNSPASAARLPEAAFFILEETAEMAENTDVTAEIAEESTNEIPVAGMDTGSQQSPEELQAELERVREALKKANKEAADRRKKLEEIERAEQKRKDAELSEMERLQKQLAERDNDLRAAWQTAAAAKFGLPDELAQRLVGNSLDEVLEDAGKLSELIPKTSQPEPKPPSPGPKTTNPANAKTGESLEERRRRLLG
jgi:hypothetical protein